MPKLTELVAPVDEPQNAEKQSKAERAFVARLDLFLLTFGCISQGMLLIRRRSKKNFDGIRCVLTLTLLLLKSLSMSFDQLSYEPRLRH